MAAKTATSPATDSDTLITTNVRMLLAREDVVPADIEDAIGIPSSTFYRRLKGGHWTAAEVGRIALYFGVGVGTLYADPRSGQSASTGGKTDRPHRRGLQQPVATAA